MQYSYYMGNTVDNKYIVEIVIVEKQLRLVTKYANLFNNFEWLCTVAYLADIFNSLNSLNISLQGKEDNIFHTEDNIEAMEKTCPSKQF